MLGRLGGDEFAAIVSNVRSGAEVDEIARRLESCFQSPIQVEGHSLRGSASIGIAIYPADGETHDQLLSAADGGMYAAKKRQQDQPKSKPLHSS